MSGANGLRLRPPVVRRRERPQLVITDVDNTLYDFGAYYEAGLRRLVETATSALDLTMRDVLLGLKEVFDRHGSIEYPFALEEFAAVRRLAEVRRREFLSEASLAFWEGASGALRPYTGVVAGLQHLRRDGVDVVAFTDAPIHEALRRLRALRIDKYLSGVVATEWFRRRPARTRVLRLADIPGFGGIPKRLTVVGRLADGERKPNPQTYLAIMRAFDMVVDQVTVIGDSPARDLQPAAEVGIRAVWARYGRRNPRAEVLLQQVVPFKLPEIDTRQDAAAAAFRAVDRFDELLEVLPTQQILRLRMD